MAYTKKSNIVTEDVSEKNLDTVNEVNVETKKSRVYNQEDLIPCRSVISGALYIEGARSHILYSWADYNDVVDMEYRDLVYLVRTRNDANIYNPRIIIEDDEFVEQNKAIKDLYDSLYTTGDLRDIISLPLEQMKKEIEKLPSGVKDSLKGLVATMIDSHTLDSVRKIKALDEIFGTQMLLTLAQE